VNSVQRGSDFKAVGAILRASRAAGEGSKTIPRRARRRRLPRGLDRQAARQVSSSLVKFCQTRSSRGKLWQGRSLSESTACGASRAASAIGESASPGGAAPLDGPGPGVVSPPRPLRRSGDDLGRPLARDRRLAPDRRIGPARRRRRQNAQPPAFARPRRADRRRRSRTGRRRSSVDSFGAPRRAPAGRGCLE